MAAGLAQCSVRDGIFSKRTFWISDIAYFRDFRENQSTSAISGYTSARFICV
jgi:hypothetical protein